MRYLLMLHADETVGASIPPEQMKGFMNQMAAYAQALEKAGAFIATEALDFASKGSLITVRDGETRVQDGPFAESREQFGGYFIIEAADDDEARKWAARCPAATWGTIEVRRIRGRDEY
ncbi:YciI family protein [Nitratireductor soli]|uniref:YciI family protein n=1 Tax=Nitratireductor soli TaxID=1670619 RepID=UPI00065E7917|nr:YciI family protein [Nitratireductor soli]